jgi:hypothetical protein
MEENNTNERCEAYELLSSPKRSRTAQPVEKEPRLRTATEESSQWLFRRGNSAEMVISEHLGDTSSMVESLTDAVNSWSLISTSTKASKGIKIERANTSKRAIMKVLRAGGDRIVQGEKG